MSTTQCSVDLTKSHITDYTLYEFYKIVYYLYTKKCSQEWTTQAESLFKRIVEHPDGLSLLDKGTCAEDVVESLKSWYEGKRLPFTQPDKVIPITEYTEKEFKQLIRRLQNGEGNEEQQCDWLVLFEDAVSHPEGIDLLDVGEPDKVVNLIKCWYAENNLQCFKAE